MYLGTELSTGKQVAIKVGSQPMDMAFRGDELFVACQGDGSVHVSPGGIM